MKIEKDQADDVVYTDINLGQPQTCGGAKPINGSPLL